MENRTLSHGKKHIEANQYCIVENAEFPSTSEGNKSVFPKNGRERENHRDLI